MTEIQTSQFIKAMQQATAYPHDVQTVEMRETHISWVFLTGELVYKVKKPIRTDFLDFGTLEQRLHYCNEEIRLNRRYAPELYLRVEPITGSFESPLIGGTGEPLEYAVVMRQFDDNKLLNRVINSGDLTGAHIDQLADEISELHRKAKGASVHDRFGIPGKIRTDAEDNIRALKEAECEGLSEALKQLETWTEHAFCSLQRIFQDRLEQGFVRECHGDLHLGNIVLIDGRATLFDGIEFNEEFRWIDVMSDVGFLVMDFADHQHRDFAYRVLNRYLELTGDYAGLNVLRWYVVYRALVRSKVALIRSQQSGLDIQQITQQRQFVKAYTELALQEIQPHQNVLIITHGLSGSGKTYHTQQLVEQSGAIRIRSDVERKRLLASTSTSDGTNAIGEGMYSSSASEQTYSRLQECAAQVLQAGYSVIVDATFLRAQDRIAFRELADQLQVPFYIVSFDADVMTLKARIQQRSQEGRDASDATVQVLEYQMQTREPLDSTEQAFVRTVSEIRQAMG